MINHTMLKSVLIATITPVIFFIWDQCLSDKRTKDCDSYKELDGFDIEEYAFNDHEMQEFEGGDSRSVCETEMCTDEVFISNEGFIKELNVSLNGTLKYNDVNLRTNNTSYKPTEKLLAHAVLRRCGESGVFSTTSLLFRGSRTNNKTLITAVRSRNSQQEGYARISRGGVLQDHVELQLRSVKGGGFEYEISIYGLA